MKSRACSIFASFRKCEKYFALSPSRRSRRKSSLRSCETWSGISQKNVQSVASLVPVRSIKRRFVRHSKTLPSEIPLAKFVMEPQRWQDCKSRHCLHRLSRSWIGNVPRSHRNLCRLLERSGKNHSIQSCTSDPMCRYCRAGSVH